MIFVVGWEFPMDYELSFSSLPALGTLVELRN